MDRWDVSGSLQEMGASASRDEISLLPDRIGTRGQTWTGRDGYSADKTFTSSDGILLGRRGRKSGSGSWGSDIRTLFSYVRFALLEGVYWTMRASRAHVTDGLSLNSYI